MCDLELQVQSSQLLRTLVEGANLSQLSLTQLESIRQQIRKDLDKLDQVSQKLQHSTLAQTEVHFRLVTAMIALLVCIRCSAFLSKECESTCSCKLALSSVSVDFPILF